MKADENACEILDCRGLVVANVNGVAVCERCRVHFTSVGFGAVFFGGCWHGVRGATYTPEQVEAFPGLIDREAK